MLLTMIHIINNVVNTDKTAQNTSLDNIQKDKNSLNTYIKNVPYTRNRKGPSTVNSVPTLKTIYLPQPKGQPYPPNVYVLSSFVDWSPAYDT